MEMQRAIQQLKKGQVAPVYILLGEETYLAERFEKELVQAVVAGEANAFNFARFDMEEVNLSDAVMEANTISFFNEPRIVWIQHPLFLTGEKPKGTIKHDLDSLIEYLHSPAESVVLVIYAPYEKLDARKKVVKELKNHAELIDISEMKEEAVKKYMQQYVADNQVEIDRDVLAFFLERTAYKLTKSINEMDKLFLFIGDSGRITRHDVTVLVPPTLDDNIFHLTDFVMQQKADQALQLYRELIALKQQPIAILALMQSNFRLFTQIVQLQKLGYDQGSIAKTLGAHPYRIKMAMQQVRPYQPDRLMQGYMQLVAIDYEIKSGQVEPNLGLEWFILAFCADRIR